MLWNACLGILAGLSAALGLWQWLAARRFPLHDRLSTLDRLPGVTILKPLKGCDGFTGECLRSWLQQQYAGPVQFLFGVASINDPVCGLVRSLLGEFPGLDASLMVCPESLGTNAKVSTLVQLHRQSKYEVVVVSDADVLVHPDLLANAVQPFSECRAEWLRRDSSSSGVVENGAGTEDEGRARPRRVGAGRTSTTSGAGAGEVGLVSCFYRLANPSTLAMRWEAVAINADFWSQVLQSNTLKAMDFALGAVMVVQRKALEAIGGFESLVNCLADDYQLGNRIVRQGYAVEICPVVVECWDPPQGWSAVWKHQLRWARTIRVCQPAPYFFSILNNATFWPLLWFVCVPSALSMVAAGGCVLLRMILAIDLQDRLTPQQAHWRSFGIVLIKDLLGAALWAGACLGNTVEWRGQRMRLHRDGTLSELR